MNTVEPIRDREKLAEIMDGLEHDKTEHGRRMYLLTATLYYTGLRVCDVIRLRKYHVSGMYIDTIEKKTGKKQHIIMPQSLRDIYDIRLADVKEDGYLFPSRNHNPDGTEKHITTRQAGYDMETIKKRFNIPYPFACHSLRKTHGYMRYKYGGDTIEVLRLHFNHADERTTRRYIGIDEEERNKNLKNLKAGTYTPPKPERRTQRKGITAAELEIDRLDRAENGRLWGLAQQEAAEKAREKKRIEAERKARRRVLDHERYLRNKAKKADT